jgi:uncharacterized protein YlxP (DUF503 family)
MALGLLTLHLLIPGCVSLKEKRGRLKPLIARLHREFNISVAELGRMDSWQHAEIGCAMISNDPAHNRRALQEVLYWVESNWPDVQVIDNHIELV